MRIGFYTDTYFPQISGVATSIQTLKEELERLGHTVIIFTTTDPNANIPDHDIVRLPSIPFVSFKDRRIVVSGVFSTFSKAKECDLDIIHTHTEFGLGLLGKQTAKHLGIPCVHTYHTMYEDYLHYIANGKLIKPSHVRQGTKLFCRSLAGIICPSERVVEKLQQYHITVPMEIIPTGVNVKKFSKYSEKEIETVRESLKMAEDGLLLLSLSRLSYEKNIQAVIKGMPFILEKVPEAKLLIIGEGPHREALEKLVKELNIENYVIFLGEIANDIVGKYYQAADYFVSASDSESQGLTYIEALASSTKIVVKGSKYLDNLLNNPYLGVTYKEDEDFATTFVDYHKNHYPKNIELQEEKLYEISSECFGEKVEKFYLEVIKYYDEFDKEDAKKEEAPTFHLFKRH